MGWRITATSETASYLKKHGIKALEFGSFLGIREKYPFPPTLHPKTELMLTSSATKQRIDLVYDITYPYEKGTDIGGHTLLALAAKGNRAAAYSPEMMENLVISLEKGIPADELHRQTSQPVYAKLSCFYKNMAENTAGLNSLPLSNGENPYQVPAFMHAAPSGGSLSIPLFKRAAGPPPCFTNIADLDCILSAMCACAGALKKNKISLPYITIAAKHGNSCGICISASKTESITKALHGNPEAIWGGEVIVNFSLGRQEALLLKESIEREKKYGSRYWMLDVIAAPSLTPEALEILGSKGRRKIFTNSALLKPVLDKKTPSIRHIRGGILSQPPHTYVPLIQAAGRKTLPLIIAWTASWFSFHGGNEVAIASGNSLISSGGGPSTVMAAEQAVARAESLNHSLSGSVFAADAFFPFTDAPEILAGAGCVAGLAPSGGKNFSVVKKYLKEKKVKMVFVPEKFRGFIRH